MKNLNKRCFKTGYSMKLIKSLIVFSAVSGGGMAIAGDHAAHWAYEGEGGPANWSRIEKGFELCKLGQEQSPIDISTRKAEKAQLPPINIAYKSSAGELLNNGHTIQINLDDGGLAVVPSGEYKLLQFHFHTPSEEKINGKSFPLVAHLVHKNDAGKLAVIGILFKEGKENAALKDIFAALPREEGRKPLQTQFNASALLPKLKGYYAFVGSLTTPPCSEGVAWHVLKTPVEMSKSQISAFRQVFKMNARPVQPLNGRKVQEAG